MIAFNIVLKHSISRSKLNRTKSNEKFKERRWICAFKSIGSFKNRMTQ